MAWKESLNQNQGSAPVRDCSSWPHVPSHLRGVYFLEEKPFFVDVERNKGLNHHTDIWSLAGKFLKKCETAGYVKLTGNLQYKLCKFALQIVLIDKIMKSQLRLST